MTRVLLVVFLWMTPGLGSVIANAVLVQANESPALASKIRFDRSQISAAGLIGSQGNLRSLSYEFCIPANAQSLAETRAIDETLQYFRSPGRIRCTSAQYLVIGSTHKPNWHEILTQLAALDYVEQIDQFFGE